MMRIKTVCIGVVLAVGVGASAFTLRQKPKADWDWNGIIGTGQSLSVGGTGNPIKSTEPLFGNFKVGTADLKWPIDSTDPKITLEPLTEPVGRRSMGYPSSWPMNIDGETPQTSAGNEISQLSLDNLKQSYTTVHYQVGESGQGMIRIRKDSVPAGVTGRSYEAAMIQTKAVTRLAKAAGKSFGVGAIFMTHGETDTGNAKYEEELYKFWSDYSSDIKAITGQKRDVLMIVSQHNRLGDYSPSTLAQWKTAVEHPASIVCSGPKYQYPYSGDALHLTTDGYRLLGEKYGQVYFERVVLGHDWNPLQPTKVDRKDKKLFVQFHVPVGPLVWDATLGDPHPSTAEWAKGKGFEITDEKGAKIAIKSAEINGSDTVVLELESDPGPNLRLSYAMVGESTLRNPQFGATPHWGLLRDSDPFVGATTHAAQPNFCVAFALQIP